MKCVFELKLPVKDLKNHEMIKYYSERKNPYDKFILQPPYDSREVPRIIEGSLFISLSPNVIAQPNGAHDLCRQLCEDDCVLANGENKVLVICYVGKPVAYTNGGESLKLKNGATLEEMEKECRENWLPNGYDYLVFVGWSMTKRSMTATFNVSKNGEAKLITPLYSIINLPKSGSLDTNFQRLMRIGHTFTPYMKPPGFFWSLACSKKLLDKFQRYGKVEEEAFEYQEKKHLPFREFREHLQERFNAASLNGNKIGKHRLSTDKIQSQKDPKSDEKWSTLAGSQIKRPVGCTFNFSCNKWKIEQRNGNCLEILASGNREFIYIEEHEWKKALKICKTRGEFERERDRQNHEE